MTTTTTFKDLPENAKTRIFGYLSDKSRQQNRIVSSDWNSFINDEFPLEVEITNENISSMLLRGNARKVTIKDLTVEIHENISFSNKLRQLEAVGKVVTSNLSILLKSCSNIEMLSFTSLREILTIESTEIVELPKVLALQIKVRGEHQMFTLAEMMLIDWITKRLEFSDLKIVLVKTCSPAEIWAEHRMESSQRSSESSSMSTIYNLSRQMTGVSSAAQSGNVLHPIPGHRNLMSDLTSGASIQAVDGSERSVIIESGEEIIQESSNIGRTSNPASVAGEAEPTALSSTSNIVPSVASAATETTEDGNQSDSAYSYSRQSIFDRVLQRNALATEEDTEDTGEIDGVPIENNFSLLPYSFSIAESPVVTNSVFIRLLLKNHQTLNQLIVNTRSDFLCFGSLVSYNEDCHKLHFENLEYNFGRSVMHMEFMLLRTQDKLTRIRIQLVEDMIVPLLMAVNASSNTLRDIDIKIISFSEPTQPFQYEVFSRCKSLAYFKILQFSRKQGLETLPVSIERLLMNGPLTISDLKILAARLINLTEVNILLNVNTGTLDVDLFKSFLRLPKLRMLSFIQCDIDVNGIEAFCKPLPGLTFSIDGPRTLNALPDIQYAMTTISEKFRRELVN